MARTVTLVLVDDAGVPLGALPPFDVQSPWWQEVGDVIAGARLRYGVDVDVLRLLSAGQAEPPGGPVTYVAQLRRGNPDRLLPVGGAAPAHPARAAWAHPNGPLASVQWAVEYLEYAGRVDVRAVQLRTWNLSAIWRLDSGTTPVAWLKQVPPFLGSEATVLDLLAEAAPGFAPRLLAVGPHGRLLLEDVPGEDRYGAGFPLRAVVAADWHAVQERLAGTVEKQVERGVPDRRNLTARIRQVAAARRADIPGLAELVAGLDARLAAVAACAVPDTLVHGDLHPGNVRGGNLRGDDAHHVVLDWGDAGISHPAYDIIRLAEGLPAGEAEDLVAAWARRWRAVVPGCDPLRAVALLRPVAALRAAVMYADVLGSIEPTEWPYHAADVPRCLAAAVEAAHA